MEFRERIYSVMVVSASEKFNDTILQLLGKENYEPIKIETDICSANRTLLERSFDIVIINSPLPDDVGFHLATDLSVNSGSGILFLAKAEQYHELNARLVPYGVFTVSKPTSAQFLLQVMRLLCATRERLRRMEKKTASVEEKMGEIRVVNRAKLLLISERGMNEAEAHRYIEKQAMDSCVTKRTIAESIVRMYR